MKKIRIAAFIVSVALVAVTAAAQSSRPGANATTETKRANKRPEAKPTPLPTPQPEDQAGDDVADAGTDGGADDGEVIKVDTSLISIPVRIIDRKGRFVGGLKKEDFTVFEDNKQQLIDLFSTEEQPFTVALVLDMSYSTTFKIAEIQQAAIAFIDQLRPFDKVMVISFDEEVAVLCEATNDRKKIYSAIKGTKISTGTSLYEAVDLTMNKKLNSITGRKAIVLFTDGVDTTSKIMQDRDNLNDASEQDLLIYPIKYDTFNDVQRMKNGPVGSTPTQVPPGGQPKSPFPFPIDIAAIGTPDTRGTSPEDYRRAGEYLDQLALRTGGQIYEASNLANLNVAFSKIASELREFYTLGYYPTSEKKAGRVRRLKVKVNREKVAVRARESYTIAEEKAK